MLRIFVLLVCFVYSSAILFVPEDALLEWAIDGFSISYESLVKMARTSVDTYTELAMAMASEAPLVPLAILGKCLQKALGKPDSDELKAIKKLEMKLDRYAAELEASIEYAVTKSEYNQQVRHNLRMVSNSFNEALHHGSEIYVKEFIQRCGKYSPKETLEKLEYYITAPSVAGNLLQAIADKAVAHKKKRILMDWFRVLILDVNLAAMMTQACSGVLGKDEQMIYNDHAKYVELKRKMGKVFSTAYDEIQVKLAEPFIYGACEEYQNNVSDGVEGILKKLEDATKSKWMVVGYYGWGFKKFGENERADFFYKETFPNEWQSIMHHGRKLGFTVKCKMNPWAYHVMNTRNWQYTAVWCDDMPIKSGNGTLAGQLFEQVKLDLQDVSGDCRNVSYIRTKSPALREAVYIHVTTRRIPIEVDTRYREAPYDKGMGGCRGDIIVCQDLFTLYVVFNIEPM